MYAYLNSGGEVLGTSLAERTLGQAQAIDPNINSIITDAPDELVPVSARRVGGSGYQTRDFANCSNCLG